jgi:mRNA interferase RelE/StbE
MTVNLSPKSAKYLSKLDSPIKNRISKALIKLSLEPPQGDIIAMSGKDGYRLRIGKYRVLFDIKDHEIIVYDIDLRGQIYK